jgi:hypothetical protein
MDGLMFDPSNPLSLTADHPLFDPGLSLTKLRQNPGLVQESLDLLGGLNGLGLINPVSGDNGLWQTVAGPLGAGGSSMGLYFLINSSPAGCSMSDLPPLGQRGGLWDCRTCPD